MATVTVTSTPVTLDSGSSYELRVENTGTVDVYVARGLQVSKVRPSVGLVIEPEGAAVTAYVLGSVSGQLTVTVTIPSNPMTNPATALTGTLVPMLSPSGGDDSAAIAAQINTYGRVNLSAGTFKWNTPQILRAVSPFRSTTNAYSGLHLEGAGEDVTIIDTSGCGATSHTTATVTAITVGATTTGTLSSAVTWADGSLVVISMPNYRRGVDSGNTIDLLNGQNVYVKATNRAGGSFTTFQLYCDAAMTTALISTGWGTFATPCKMRRYETDRTIPYTPIVRLTGPASGAPDVYNLNVSNLTFRNTTTQALTYERQGICVSMETDLSSKDSVICQQAKFENVRWEGYDCAVLLDNVTNCFFDFCDFHGNNYYVWSAENTDIIKFQSCALGEDFPIQGQPVQQVLAPALVYYAPNNPSNNFAGSRNSWTFDSCWFMGVRTVTGGTEMRTYGGSQVYYANGINPKPLSFFNCYFEQVSWLADGQAISLRACHFGNFSRDANLSGTGRAVFNLHTDNFDGARFTMEDCTADPAVGQGPIIAYVSASNWGTNAGAANEESTPTILWRNNDLPAGAGNAHIVDFSNTARKILLDDGFVTGVQVKGGGDYTFEGVLQVAGRPRMIRSVSPFTGTVTPDVCAATRYWSGVMSGTVTIANPTVGGSTTFSSLFAANGLSGSSYFMFGPLRQMPLEFFFEQDATGGRTVAFGADFVTTGLTLTGATANQKTIIRFQWNGTKWVPMGANTWS